MAVRGNLRTTLAGFAGALAVLAVLFYVVGVGDIAAALVLANPLALVAVLVATSAWLTAWAMALRTVLSVLGVTVAPRRAVLVFTSVIFANNVTPFGQAGGEPVSALLVSRSTDSEYETALASVASVDALNFVPSIALALLGLLYYAAQFTLGRRLELALAVVAVLAVVVPTVGVLLWRNRGAVEEGVVDVLTPVAAKVADLLPNRSPAPRAIVSERVGMFFEAIERVGTDRRRLGLALGLSATGWLAKVASLWLSLYAVEQVVSLAALLVVVPVANIAGMTPLPGGLGGIEAALVVLLVTTTTVDPATASAAVVVHRAATYWLPVVVGGSAASAIGAPTRA